MFEYNMRWLQEAAWAAAVAAGLVVLQVASDTDFAAVSDWRTWLIALGGAVLRAAVGAVLGRRTA